MAGSLYSNLDARFVCFLPQEICYIQLFTYCLQASSKKYNTYRGQLHFPEIILQPAGTPLPWELLNWSRSYLHFVHLHTSNYVSVSAYLNLISLIMNPWSCQWEGVRLFVTLVSKFIPQSGCSLSLQSTYWQMTHLTQTKKLKCCFKRVDLTWPKYFFFWMKSYLNYEHLDNVFI